MNTLKRCIIIFTGYVSLCSISYSQTGWVVQTSGTSEHLRSVFFVNDMTGWTVGFSGKILKTTNGGTNWLSQSSGTSEVLFSVYFTSPLIGWAAGSSGVIITTANGGTNWTPQVSGSTDAIFSIFFISASTGWAVGDFMSILKTTNSGINWSSLLSGEVSLNSVIFTSPSIGYIAGNGGYVMKSTNGGLTWSVQNSNVSYNLASIHFPPGVTTTGFTVGMGSPSPPILKSTDSGLNWTIQPVPLGDALNSVFFINASTGWAAGYTGTIKYTTNGGTNWSDQVSTTSNALRSIYFINSLTGWASGELGTIVKTTNGGISAIEPIGNNLPKQFILYQNYPNPFNPYGTIKFDIPKATDVKMAVFNVIGQEVSTLVNIHLAAGSYSVVWDASNFPSGVYFYRINAGTFTDIKKMVLVK